MTAHTLQARVSRWVTATFGAGAIKDTSERMRRLLEETLELARAEGFTESDINRLTTDVYAKPKGSIRDEVGDVSVTMLAYCSARSLNAYQVTYNAVAALEARDKTTTIHRQTDKSARGLGRPVRGLDCT